MVDSGSCIPLPTVFTTTSRWLSSTITTPSVPTISIQVVEKFGDRKSTRLNSSHSQISYAVFCLKKKKKSTKRRRRTRLTTVRETHLRYRVEADADGRVEPSRPPSITDCGREVSVTCPHRLRQP